MDTDDLQESSDQNVFEMFVANGGPGFWIRRTTWGGTCARVIRVGSMTSPGPYFGNPSVLMDVYSLNASLKEELAQVPAPGTYKTWRWIDPPLWSMRIDLRSLDDPAIDTALESLDRKRHKAKPANLSSQAAQEAERVLLSVPFARKGGAKRIGARWSSTEKKLVASDSGHGGHSRKHDL